MTPQKIPRRKDELEGVQRYLVEASAQPDRTDKFGCYCLQPRAHVLWLYRDPLWMQENDESLNHGAGNVVLVVKNRKTIYKGDPILMATAKKKVAKKVAPTAKKKVAKKVKGEGKERKLTLRPGTINYAVMEALHKNGGEMKTEAIEKIVRKI